MRRIRRPSTRAAWQRLAVAFLTLLVSLGAAMPAYARLVAGPRPHVCHCEARGSHAQCSCPICFPELRAPDDGLGGHAIKGVCGDEDAFDELDDDLAVPPTSLVVPAPSAIVITTRVLTRAPPRWMTVPEPRPPRAHRAA